MAWPPALPASLPQGKVVFLAPTRPLVAQQVDACYRFMGVSHTAMAELTGALCMGALPGMKMHD